MAGRKYFLTFPQEILDKPILYELGREFAIVPNIRGASVTEHHALMAVELAGENEEVDRALVWLVARGVKVEPLAEGPHGSP